MTGPQSAVPTRTKQGECLARASRAATARRGYQQSAFTFAPLIQRSLLQQCCEVMQPDASIEAAYPTSGRRGRLASSPKGEATGVRHEAL